MNRETILETAEKYSIAPQKVELDYQMTRVLRKLSENWPDCVFKGGTSLFKCFGLSKRFSEDIDISFDRNLSKEEKRNLKASIVEIAQELDMEIKNLYSTKSKRDYNCYLLEYKSLLDDDDCRLSEVDSSPNDEMTNIVKVETSIACPCFPTEKRRVNCLSEDQDFDIQVQSLERTFVDKVFAICDYYMKGRTERLSRHIFDLYKIWPRILQKNDFESLKLLVSKVRAERATMWICPSAKGGVNIPELLTEIVNEAYYKEDYLSFATEYENPPLDYAQVVEVISKISQSGLFDK